MTTTIRRSFVWALEPSWAERPPDTPQRWWLVEMENGEPRRAFLPPMSSPSETAIVRASVMEPAHRDSFVRWSITNIPVPVEPSWNYTLGPKGSVR